MNLPEFRALLAAYALENPNRPLSEVTVLEFALWRDIREWCVTPEEIMAFPFVPAPVEGAPRCDLCKDTGWRRSVERGRKVPCECGARGVLANTERMALPRIPEGNPGAGNINNCSLANMSAEADCQMCKGECPDRNRFAAKREPARTCTCGHFTSDNLATHAVYCELARNPVPK